MPTPPRILCEVPPRTPDLCTAMWAGQGDPLYAIGSSWRHRRELASDLGLPWSTGEGEGFYIALSLEEISALRAAAYRFLGDRPGGGFEDEDEEWTYEDAAFFLGLPRDEGPGWPADYGDIVQDEGDDGAIMPGPALVDTAVYGLVLAGEQARRELAGK